MFFEDLEQNKTDLYRSGAVLEQRRWNGKTLDGVEKK
jgi:hypothetical protein